MSSKIDNICNDLFHTGRISFNEWTVITQGVTDYAHSEIISTSANAQQLLLSDEGSDTPWAVDESPRCEDKVSYTGVDERMAEVEEEVAHCATPDPVDEALTELERAYAVWFEKRQGEDRRALGPAPSDPHRVCMKCKRPDCPAGTDVYVACVNLPAVKGKPHAWVSNGVCCHRHATTLQKLTTMIVCPECGDKRCPKAANCESACISFEAEIANALKSIEHIATEELLTEVLNWATDYGISRQGERGGGFVLSVFNIEGGRNVPVTREYAAVFECIYKDDYVGEYSAKD